MIVMLGALPAMLDTTIVNIAVNHLRDVFNTDLAVVQWAVTGYVLALGIAVPFAGWLLKRIDQKTLFMAATGAFLAGSLLSGLAWSAGALIGFRIVQGLAAGIVMPTLTTFAVSVAGGSENLGKLMSLMGIPVVFAPIVGPVAGGLILQYLPWQWLFFINLPVGAAGLVLMQVRLLNFPAADPSARLDWTGIALLAVTSGASVYGVTQVVHTGSRAAGVACLAVGALALAAYLIVARRKQTSATVPLTMFASRNFTAAFVSLFLAGFATNGPMLLLPMLFQNVRHLSVIMAGLWLIPQGLGMLVGRPVIGRLTDEIGAKWVTIPSILVTLAGTIPFAFFAATTPDWVIWLVLFVRGVGVGGFTVPVMADSYVGLGKPLVPAASVATRMIQNIGAAFGSAVLATVVAVYAGWHPQDVMGSYHAGFTASLVFMAAAVAPAWFLTNKLRARERM